MEGKRRKKTRIRRKNMGMKKLILFFILIFIIIQLLRVIIPASVTFSRYVYSKVRNYYLTSKEFYFNSDKLSRDTAHFEASNWSGVDEYTISINMNSKHNNSEVSKVDIDYNITASFEVYKNTGEKYDNPEEYIDFYLEKTSGVIRQSANNKDYFEIKVKPKKPLADNDYVFIKVSATSVSPYVETLTGEFKISIGNLGMNYQIEDQAYSPYLELRITNTLDYYIVDEAFGAYEQGREITINEYLALSDADKKKCHSMIISLKFDPNVIVMDTTSNLYLLAEDSGDAEYSSKDGYNYVTSVKFNIDAEESKVVKFYKINAEKDYTYPFGTEPLVFEEISYT